MVNHSLYYKIAFSELEVIHRILSWNILQYFFASILRVAIFQQGIPEIAGRVWLDSRPRPRPRPRPVMNRRSNSHPSAHKSPNKYWRADVRARHIRLRRTRPEQTSTAPLDDSGGNCLRIYVLFQWYTMWSQRQSHRCDACGASDGLSGWARGRLCKAPMVF